MDDKDQTQIRSAQSSDGQQQARQQPSTGQSAVNQQAMSFSQTTSSLAKEAQNSQPLQTTGSLAEQTQRVNQSQPRSPRHLTRSQSSLSQPPLPQPLLFPDPESDILVTEQIILAPVRRQRLRGPRRWLRSRAGRVVIPLLTLLIGLAIGLTSVIWYGLSGEGSLVTIVPAARGNLVVDANQSFVSQLVSNDLLSAGLPGHVQNVTVTLKHGAELIIQGDDAYPVVFVTITKHFTVDVQPYVQACILQVRITHADLSGIPVTTFVQTFQSKINQQLARKPAGLPSGFTYCTVGVSTEPGGMYITYQAVPVKS